MANKIENKPNITDFLSKNPGSIYTPIAPQDYEGKQVILNADRLIFNARLAADQAKMNQRSGLLGAGINLLGTLGSAFIESGGLKPKTGGETTQ